MKTLICIPCLDQVNTSFVRSLLSVRPVGDIQFAFTQSSLIYDARNILAVQAITGGYDRTLWFDSDMTVDPDIMTKLSETMDEGYDLVSGLYFTRKPPYRPVIYDGCRVFENEDGRHCAAICFDEYPENSVFDIEACGFGGVMVSVDLLKKVRDKYGLPFSPISGFGEDLSFCIRAHALNAKMVCNSSVKMGHCGTVIINEETYKENKNACKG
jgi:hypothetical protein